MWPSSTMPSRPSRLSIRSVSWPTIPTPPARRTPPRGPHLAGAVEPLADALHPATLGVPVEEHGAVEEVLELPRRHPGLLRERGGGEAARHPGDLLVQAAAQELGARLREQRLALGGEVGAVTRVLRRADVDPRVRLAPRLAVGGRGLLEQVDRRLARP